MSLFFTHMDNITWATSHLAFWLKLVSRQLYNDLGLPQQQHKEALKDTCQVRSQPRNIPKITRWSSSSQSQERSSNQRDDHELNKIKRKMFKMDHQRWQRTRSLESQSQLSRNFIKVQLDQLPVHPRRPPSALGCFQKLPQQNH